MSNIKIQISNTDLLRFLSSQFDIGSMGYASALLRKLYQAFPKGGFCFADNIK